MWKKYESINESPNYSLVIYSTLYARCRHYSTYTANKRQVSWKQWWVDTALIGCSPGLINHSVSCWRPCNLQLLAAWWWSLASMLQIKTVIACDDCSAIHYAPVGVRTAAYCDQPVCLCVCLSVSGTAGPIRTKFCVQIPCGLVLLRRRCAALCTSGFMDDVTFGRNGRHAERWRLHRAATAMNDVSIAGRSLMSMNACYSDCWSVKLFNILALVALCVSTKLFISLLHKNLTYSSLLTITVAGKIIISFIITIQKMEQLN